MAIQRKRLTRTEREFIFQKTNGHCAYCGRELKYEQMQVDHVIPLDGWNYSGPDTLDNMLPSCRSCNHYKSRSSLETFRKMLERIPGVLQRDNVTYQIAVRFGLVIPSPHPVKFYFEQNPDQFSDLFRLLEANEACNSQI